MKTKGGVIGLGRRYVTLKVYNAVDSICFDRLL